MTELEIGKKIKKPIEQTYHKNAVAWCSENNATFEDKGEYYEVIAIQVPALKEAKLAELTSAFDTAAQNAHLMSSLGFEIDANETANRDIEGLTLVMSDTDTTMFCDYNNQFHEVTRVQLETMRREIVVNSQRLYQVKWTYRTQIEAATTVDELDAITITFGEA